MTMRLMALALLGCLLALHSGVAQDRKPGTDQPADAPQPRTVYPVRNADPAAIAEILARHFRGQAEVSALNNGLLVSASPAVTDELGKLLEQLDRKPRMVQIELVLADVSLKKGADGKDVAVDLSGDTAAKLEALAKAGQATVQRVKLAAVEGQPVSSTTGGNRPFVTSRAVGGAGGFGGKGGGGPIMQRSVSYQAVGTTVRLTARVGTDETVAVDLNLQDSRVRQPEAGEEDAGPALDNSTLTTLLSVPAGKAVMAQSVRTEGKTGATLSLVLVTARTDAPGPTSK